MKTCRSLVDMSNSLAIDLCTVHKIIILYMKFVVFIVTVLEMVDLIPKAILFLYNPVVICKWRYFFMSNHL